MVVSSPRLPPATNFHIPSLDGIRALAALLVFWSHCDMEDVVPGGLGVTVFFFLSGFLITTLLRLEYESSDRISLKRFYLRRIYRILPPLYIVLCLLMLPFVRGPTHSHVTTWGLIAQFAQFTNYFVIANGVYSIIPGSGQMWSLAVEEHFYLLFPVGLSLAFRKWNYRQIVAGLFWICVLILIWRCIAINLLGFSSYYTYTATDCRIDSLLFGCILALWCSPLEETEVIAERRAPWVLVSSLAVLAGSLLVRNPVFRETFRYTIQGLALMPIFYCAVRFHRWACFRWLGAKPMVWMGLISYTFYLVHVKALAIASRYVPRHSFLWPATGFALSIIVSVLMYWLVERHMAALRKRLHPA